MLSGLYGAPNPAKRDGLLVGLRVTLKRRSKEMLKKLSFPRRRESRVLILSGLLCASGVLGVALYFCRFCVTQGYFKDTVYEL
jgi:hypothetical protein